LVLSDDLESVDARVRGDGNTQLAIELPDRSRLDTPTTAYEIGRRSIPDAPPSLKAVPPVLQRPPPRTPDARPTSDPGATSPWATAPVPPEGGFEPASVWGPVNGARANASGAFATSGESPLASTVLVERPSTALERRRKLNGRWFAAVVVLGVLAGGLALALAVQVASRPSLDPDAATSVAPPSAETPMAVDPVPQLTPMPSASVGGGRGGPARAPSTNGASQSGAAVVGSSAAKADASSRSDVEPKPRPSIPSAIE
jgi:hypothetical protein